MKIAQRNFLSFFLLCSSTLLVFEGFTPAYFLLFLIILVQKERFIAVIFILIFCARLYTVSESYFAGTSLEETIFSGQLSIDRSFSSGKKAFAYSDSLDQYILLDHSNELSNFKKYYAEGKLVKPKKMTNPSAFNQYDFCFQNGVYLELKIDSLTAVQSDNTIKSKLYDHINESTQLLSKSLKGILFAGLLGNKLFLTSDDRTLFAVSGLSHFFALSGLHVGLIVFVVWTILSQLTRRFWPRYIFIVIFLCSYISLVGIKPPIVRAAIMTNLFLYGRYQFKYMNSFAILWITAFINCCFFPRDIFQLSFWLSYLALFAILYGLFRYNRLNSIYSVNHGKSIFKRSLQYVIVVLLPYIGTMPLIFLLFSNISLASMANNLILILPLSLLLYALMLFTFVSFISTELALQIGLFLDFVIAYMKKIMIFFSKISPLENTGTFLYLLLGFLIVGVFLHLRHKPIRKVLLALTTLCFFALTIKIYIHYNWLQLRVFDLGQAQAILVSHGDWHALYDAGKETRKRLWKKNELAPILKRVGVDTLDIVLISHKDFDHYGNLAGLQFRQLENHPAEIDSVFPNKIEHKNLSLFHLPARRHFRGTNNNSLVYKGVFGDFSFLLTGDIEVPRENELVSYTSDFLKSDVLSVAHHGSKSSSRQAFLNAALPSLAVISVGEKNRYGHPDSDVLARLSSAEIWRTDKDSYLHLISNGKDFWQVAPLLERLFF